MVNWCELKVPTFQRSKSTAKIVVEVVGSKYKLNDVSLMVLGKIVRVLDVDVLEDYEGKSVRIPGFPAPAEDAVAGHTSLDVASRPADTKASFGFDTFGAAVGQLLRDLQPDDAACILARASRSRELKVATIVREWILFRVLLLSSSPSSAPLNVRKEQC